MVPELNPAQSRGKAVAAAFVSHWACNMFIGQTFLTAVERFGLGSVYAGFGAMSLGGLLYISRAVPETRGKSFEQIQGELGR
jgi:nitroreductase